MPSTGVTDDARQPGRTALIGLLAVNLRGGTADVDAHRAGEHALVAVLFGCAQSSQLCRQDRLAKANRTAMPSSYGHQFVVPPWRPGGRGSAALAWWQRRRRSSCCPVLPTLVGNFRPEAGAPMLDPHEIAEGLRTSSGHKVLRTLALCVGVSNLEPTAFDSVLPFSWWTRADGAERAGYGSCSTPSPPGLIRDAHGRRHPAPARHQRPCSSPCWSSRSGAGAGDDDERLAVAFIFAVSVFVNVVWNVLRSRSASGSCPTASRPGQLGLPLAGVGHDFARRPPGGVLGELVGLPGCSWGPSPSLCLPAVVGGERRRHRGGRGGVGGGAALT